MIAEERLPPLRWGFPVPCHVLGDRGLANFDAELEEFAMDSRSTPQRIGEAHGADQLANFERHLWPATARSATSIARTSESPRDASG